uniref:Uncharacterized protein n=1 Tax=Rhizophora mucronata TaxID=61149 RepID=A0A2P2NMF0_RHIMU
MGHPPYQKSWLRKAVALRHEDPPLAAALASLVSHHRTALSLIPPVLPSR